MKNIVRAKTDDGKIRKRDLRELAIISVTTDRKRVCVCSFAEN